MSKAPKSVLKHVFGRHLKKGMTLLDSEGQPLEILEFSGYLEDLHPEVPDFRIATCSPDRSVVVYDGAVYLIVTESSRSSTRTTGRED